MTRTPACVVALALVALATHPTAAASSGGDDPLHRRIRTDDPRMQRLLDEGGRINPHASTPGIAFDTQAAIDAGRQVLSELATMTGD